MFDTKTNAVLSVDHIVTLKREAVQYWSELQVWLIVKMYA